VKVVNNPKFFGICVIQVMFITPNNFTTPIRYDAGHDERGNTNKFTTGYADVVI